MAEPTSRKAMDMQVNAAEDLGSFSLLLFCWVIVICNMTMDVSGSRCPKLSFWFSCFDMKYMLRLPLCNVELSFKNFI